MSEAGAGPQDGFRVVLTADRSLMADYRVLFEGMLSTSQSTTTPSPLMNGLLAPRLPAEGIRAGRAPLGLRRVEAALLRDGWSEEEVAVVPPRRLQEAVGPRTRAVGISSGDPLGMGMNSTTMSGIAGGEIYTSRRFGELLSTVDGLRERVPKLRVALGGPGAWQLARRPEVRDEFGIDLVVLGPCEDGAGELFRGLCNGNPSRGVTRGSPAPVDRIPPIHGPSLMGAVEVSRGCGLGCRFCTMARVPMQHLAPEPILTDVRVNAEAGQPNVSLITEDIFRYGAEGTGPRPEALLGLLEEIRGVPGVELIQTDHANVTSAAAFSDDQLRRAHQLMAGPCRDAFVWLNLGVETASGGLLAESGSGAKMAGCPPRQWGELCAEQVGRLQRAGFFPLVSLMLGLPGEKPRHLEETLSWVSALEETPAAVFPMFYAPVDGESRPFTVDDMTPLHWRLMRRSYRLNFRWVPRLCWHNQGAVGRGLPRRLLTRAAGRMGALWWKLLFAWRSGTLWS